MGITSGRLARAVCAGAVLLAATGCASLSEKECLTVNWTDQGYRDGRNGYPLTRMEDHREACAQVGVAVDDRQYRAGRDQGVLEYCTPENGMSEGRLGRSYRNACPARLEGAFLAHHEMGMRVYRAGQKVDSLGRQSRQLQKKLEKEKNDKERGKLRRELRELDRQLVRARNDLRREERRLP